MARPKGSKNKPKNTSVQIPVAEKRPRGRPRKNAISLSVPPNPNMVEPDEFKQLKESNFPEIDLDDDYGSMITPFSSGNRRSHADDDWGNTGLDSFSIGIDSLY